MPSDFARVTAEGVSAAASLPLTLRVTPLNASLPELSAFNCDSCALVMLEFELPEVIVTTLAEVGAKVVSVVDAASPATPAFTETEEVPKVS
jgi:hypothetical protein